VIGPVYRPLSAGVRRTFFVATLPQGFVLRGIWFTYLQSISGFVDLAFVLSESRDASDANILAGESVVIQGDATNLGLGVPSMRVQRTAATAAVVVVPCFFTVASGPRHVLAAGFSSQATWLTVGVVVQTEWEVFGNRGGAAVVKEEREIRGVMEELRLAAEVARA